MNSSSAVWKWWAALLCFTACSPSEQEVPSNGPSEVTLVPERIANFRLHDHAGRSHELRRLSDRRGVVLFTVGNGCPIVRRQLETMRELRERFGDELEFLFLNANPQDSLEAVRSEAESFSIEFPILLDRSQAVARSLGVTRTGEAFLLDPSSGRIHYRGAIDDRLDYGVARADARETWLADALEAYLDHREPPVAVTEPRGCLILLEDWPEEVTFVHDVAPVLERRCLECHRPGHIAPFAFDRYETARGWSPMMAEVLRTKRMPPWHADGEIGTFDNDRSLTAEEKRALLRWVELGAPRGEGTDPLADREFRPPQEWPLGPPDAVVKLPDEVIIPARGEIDYQYFEVEVELEEDGWVRALDVQPGNASVVHHVLVFLRYPEHLAEHQPDFQGGLSGFFAGHVPGSDPWLFPENTGKFLPAGSSVVFQMHYVSTGKEETDRTRMGIYLHESTPEHELHVRSAHLSELRIPPGERDHEVTASHVVPKDVWLWGMSPHMHYRGSRFAIAARFPDGERRELLSVPHYDFNWQTTYLPLEPIFLPEGTVVYCRGAFDNSASNPANPDPDREVRFGPQTTDEMFIGYLIYSEAPPSTAPLNGLRDGSLDRN